MLDSGVTGRVGEVPKYSSSYALENTKVLTRNEK